MSNFLVWETIWNLILTGIVIHEVVLPRIYRQTTKNAIQGPISPYLPLEIHRFLTEEKTLFIQYHTAKTALKRQPGRPALFRLPFFLTYLWNRTFLKKSPEEALQLVNSDPVLRKFFQVPPKGLKLGTYTSFTRDEIPKYLSVLVAQNVKELIQKGIIDGKVLAVDDFPMESRLNLSKTIDFPLPKEEEVRTFFKNLPSLTWLDEFLKNPPNKQRGWTEYLRLYLFYLLWGFVSETSFNKYLKEHPQIQVWLGLQKKPVQTATFLDYIDRLFDHPKATEINRCLATFLLTLAPIRAKLPRRKAITDVRELQGILGNFRHSKDSGAQLHYNSSKGKYYLGRLGRLIVDTKTQLPLFVTIVSAKQAVAKDLQTFGTSVTQLFGNFIKPLIVLFDKGFHGTDRVAALHAGFTTVFRIIITKPYNRFKSTFDIFRAERTAVERAIGHLETHLVIEHPEQLGPSAAEGWALASVYIVQRVALYNHTFHSELSPTTMAYLQRNSNE